MSDLGEVSKGCSKGLGLSSPFEGNEGLEEKSEFRDDEPVIVQEQIIIIPPEVISKILGLLNFRSLKRASLVCRSWSREGRFYMRNRGIVPLRSSTIGQFVDTVGNKLPDLPQPFGSLDVIEFHGYYSSGNRIPPEDLVIQISGLIAPPLQLEEQTMTTTPRLTNLCLLRVPLELALPLINQSALSLECVHVFAVPCKGSFVPQIDLKQVFPKLRHLAVNALRGEDSRGLTHFPSVVAWIAGSSPQLETFVSSGSVHSGTDRLGSQLLLEVNLENVKSLLAVHFNLDAAVLEHFLTIPFWRLEYLKMSLSRVNGFLQSGVLLVATVAKCKDTLRVLDLSGSPLEGEGFAGFPVCPALQELTLPSFPSLPNFVVDRFPSLKVLDVGLNIADFFTASWKEMTPCVSLKTLRVSSYQDLDRDEFAVQLFEKFPALERLCLDISFLLRCCRLKARGEPRFAHILEGVKHLELYDCFFLNNPETGFSELAVIKGIETITMRRHFEKGILSIPCSELPFLKLFRFAWMEERGKCSVMAELLELASRVKKVVITNCCRTHWEYPLLTKNFLEAFMDNARNAECGCSEWGQSSPFNKWGRY